MMELIRSIEHTIKFDYGWEGEERDLSIVLYDGDYYLRVIETTVFSGSNGRPITWYSDRLYSVTLEESEEINSDNWKNYTRDKEGIELKFRTYEALDPVWYEKYEKATKNTYQNEASENLDSVIEVPEKEESDKQRDNTDNNKKSKVISKLNSIPTWLLFVIIVLLLPICLFLLPISPIIFAIVEIILYSKHRESNPEKAKKELFRAIAAPVIYIIMIIIMCLVFNILL